MSEFDDAEDLPLGLMMGLGQDLEAMSSFAALSDEKKEVLIAYIKSAATGDEAKARIEEVLGELHDTY